jgi:hypothetical protein
MFFLMKYINVCNHLLLLPAELPPQLGSFWIVYEDSFSSLSTNETLALQEKPVQIDDNLEHLAEDKCVSLLLQENQVG